jgi:hypothetical protein
MTCMNGRHATQHAKASTAPPYQQILVPNLNHAHARACRGANRLSVTYGGQDVRGSPFTCAWPHMWGGSLPCYTGPLGIPRLPLAGGPALCAAWGGWGQGPTASCPPTQGVMCWDRSQPKWSNAPRPDKPWLAHAIHGADLRCRPTLLPHPYITTLYSYLSALATSVLAGSIMSLGSYAAIKDKFGNSVRYTDPAIPSDPSTATLANLTVTRCGVATVLAGQQ